MRAKLMVYTAFSNFEFWNVTFSMDKGSSAVPSILFKFSLP